MESDQNTTSELVGLLRGKLRGAIICLSHAWGGLEQVAAQDAFDLASRGIPVQFLCLRGSLLDRYILENGQHLPLLQRVPLHFRPSNYFDLKLKKVLSRLVSDGVNLIHTHQTSLLGSISPWLWRKPHVALIATRHLMNRHSKKDFFHRAIYQRLDSFMVISQTMRKNILATHSVREKRVQVVPLGLDFSAFDPVKTDPTLQRQAWGAGPQSLVIGVVGRIDPAKGQSTFIKAAAGLSKHYPSSDQIKYVIVGEETFGTSMQYLQSLKKMVKQFRLQDRVIFAGFKRNIPEVMKSLDIFVMPSREEAFGLVAIEAMAMGCPVVISNSGSVEEIVGEDQQYGLKAKPGDPYDLQRQLRTLIDDPAGRREIAKRGQDFARDRYDRSKRLSQILYHYWKALRRRQNVPVT